MKTKYAVPAVFAGFAALMPLLAVAQQTQPPASPQPPFWFMPVFWHQWYSDWTGWWIFPFFMFLVMMVFAVACFRSRGASRWDHRWGPCGMMDRMPGFDRFASDARARGVCWGTGREEIPVPRGGYDSGFDTQRSAIEVLNLRYAKGEIQKAEYDEMKQTILSGGQP